MNLRSGFPPNDEPICTFNLAAMSFKIRVECYGQMAVVAAKSLHQGTRAVIAGFIGLGHRRTADLTVIAYNLDLPKGPDRDLK